MIMILGVLGLPWLVSGFCVRQRRCPQRLQRLGVIEEDAAKRVWERVALSDPDLCQKEVQVGEDAPEEIRGTWYVNGLSSCRVGDERLVHPFEAHGFIKAFSFDGQGRVTMRTRFVETDVQKYETIAKRPLYRGAMSNVADFDTFPNFLLNALSPSTRAVAQLAVRRWGKDRLLASTDNAPWYKLDPVTLETIGEERMNNQALIGEKMLAHTRIDKKANLMCAAATEFNALENQTKVVLYEFDALGNQVSRFEFVEPFFVFHDFTITDEYFVIPVNPGKFDLKKLPNFIIGRSPATDIFQLDDARNLALLLLPRGSVKKDTKSYHRIDLGRFGAAFHVGPHWYEDGCLVGHAFVFDQYRFGAEMGFDIRQQEFNPTPWSLSNGGPKLHRIIVDGVHDLDSSTVEPKLREFKKLSEIPTDMPTMHPDRDGLKSRYVYGTAGIRDIGWFPFNALVKYDLHQTHEVDIWRPSNPEVRDNCVTSEPYFLPRDPESDDEDNGWLLSLLHNAADNITELLVFDAKHLSDGPIWSTPVGSLWPWNVHTTFDHPPK